MISFKGMRNAPDIIITAVRWYITARITIAGIELVHMLRKGQMRSPDGEKTSWVEQFFSLAFAT